MKKFFLLSVLALTMSLSASADIVPDECILSVAATQEQTKRYELKDCRFYNGIGRNGTSGSPITITRYGCFYSESKSLSKCRSEQNSSCLESRRENVVIGTKTVSLSRKQMKQVACRKAIACESAILSPDFNGDLAKIQDQLNTFKQNFDCRD